MSYQFMTTENHKHVLQGNSIDEILSNDRLFIDTFRNPYDVRRAVLHDYCDRFDEILLKLLGNDCFEPIFGHTKQQRLVSINKLVELLPQFSNAILNKHNQGISPHSREDLFNIYPFDKSSKDDLSSELILFEEHMAEVLYHEGGYYESGTVVIGDKADGAHFTTNATKNNALAFIMAIKALNIYSKIVDENENPDKFSIIELSGGNGKLSNDILKFIQQFASDANVKHHESWKKLYDILEYKIYEISSGLAEQQKSINEEFQLSGKFGVIKKSAVEVVNENYIDLCISNELFDMLQWNDFLKTDDGMIKVKVCLPFMNKEFEELLSDEQIKSNAKFISSMQNVLPNYDFNGKKPINKETYNKIKEIIKSKSLLGEILSWEFVYVDLGHFPQLLKITKDNESYFTQLYPNVEHHVSNVLINLGNIISKIPTRLSVHLDYARAVHGGTFCDVRVYGENVSGFAMNYQFQENVDITTEPDFNLLSGLITKDSNNKVIFDHQSILYYQDELFMDVLCSLPYQQSSEIKNSILEFIHMKALFTLLSHSSYYDPKKDIYNACGATIGKPLVDKEQNIRDDRIRLDKMRGHIVTKLKDKEIKLENININNNNNNNFSHSFFKLTAIEEEIGPFPNPLFL